MDIETITIRLFLAVVFAAQARAETHAELNANDAADEQEQRQHSIDR